MRFALIAALIGLASVAQAAPARVALLPAGDVAGKGSGKALDAAVREALVSDHVPIATGAQLARAAKLARIKLRKGLSAAAAAGLVGRGGFAGVVAYRRGKGGAFAQLVDGAGTVSVERPVSVVGGVASAGDATAFADAVAALLGLSAPPPAPIAAPLTPAPAASAPATPPPPPPPPPATTETAAVYAGPEGAASSESHDPAAGYLLRVGVFAGGGTRLFLPPAFSYVTSTPYPVGGVSLEVFPFWGFGLGIVGDFALGLVTDQIRSTPGTFTSQDLRFDAALAYRLRLFSGPFGTFLMPKAGIGMRNFDAPASRGIGADDRLIVEAGLSITQPIVPSYLRLTVAAMALPLAKQGSAGQTAYGASSTFGLQWSAELGGDLFFGFEWALGVDQERFWDSYTGPPATGGVDLYTCYTGQLRFRL